MTGKKTMGTVSPGNNSGKGVVNGSVIASGITRQANDPMLYTKLKMIAPFLLNKKVSNPYKRPANNDTIKLNPIRLPTLMIVE